MRLTLGSSEQLSWLSFSVRLHNDQRKHKEVLPICQSPVNIKGQEGSFSWLNVVACVRTGQRKWINFC